MEKSGTASRRYGCPNCGSGLRYDIASRKMRCDQCGGLTDLGQLPPEPEEESLDVTEFHCPQCGAAVYSTDTEITGFCTFCGSDVVLTGKLARTKRPAKIVPFSVTREACEAAYHDKLKKYFLAPSDLKKAETVSHFRPVYVPFWSYRVEAHGPFHAKGHKTYTSGKKRYEESYSLSMQADIRQDGILYDASVAFEDETAAMLKHTAGNAVPFHPAYLSGFYAQAADVPARTYEQEALATALRMFLENVKQQNGMDSVETAMGRNYGLPNPEFQEELFMMPVWLLAHRQGARVVYTAVNGQSGEVVCDMPVSGKKVAGVTLALFALLFALIYSFLTLRPEILMTLCAILTAVTHFQFSAAQQLLQTRKNRFWEPDFASGETFRGPAQAMLNVKKDQGTVSTRDTSAAQRALNIFLPLIAVAAYFLFTASNSNGSVLRDISYAIRNLSSSYGNPAATRTFALFVMGTVLILIAIDTFRRLDRAKNGPLWPRLLCMAACAAGLVFLILRLVEDTLFYGCAAAMLLSSAIELLIINRAHNEYASRPVPFFGEKEGNEA